MWLSCVPPALLWRILPLVCTLLGSRAVAQAPAELRANEESGKQTLSGSVINSVTGEPIRRALVQIEAGGERSAFTDGNGHFEFDDLPHGQSAVQIRKPGFFEERQLDGGASLPIMAVIGPDSQPLVIKLVPESVILGTVQSASGEPIENFPLKAMTARIVDGRKKWEPAGGASTNEDGEFRIANLVPGLYYLEAGPSWNPDDLRPLHGRREGYPALFYPGVPDVASASPLEVGPGQQVNADLRLSSVPFFQVSGRLSVPQPGSPASIWFVDRLGNPFSFVERFDGDSGRFEAVVPGGSYTLEATDWSNTGTPASAEMALNVNSDIAGIELVFEASKSLPIVVKTENTRAEQETLRPAPGRLQLLTLHRIENDSPIGTPEYSSSIQAGQNPSLVLSNVPPGRYSVEFMANRGRYVSSAQFGSTDLLSEELTITAGAQNSAIEVTLRNEGATLVGRVNTGQVRLPAKVVLMPNVGSRVQTRSADTSPDGTFALANLPPGNYKVLAFDLRDGLEYANPEVLERYISRAAEVTLQLNGRHKVTLDLLHVTN